MNKIEQVTWIYTFTCFLLFQKAFLNGAVLFLSNFSSIANANFAANCETFCLVLTIQSHSKENLI